MALYETNLSNKWDFNQSGGGDITDSYGGFTLTNNGATATQLPNPSYYYYNYVKSESDYGDAGTTSTLLANTLTTLEIIVKTPSSSTTTECYLSRNIKASGKENGWRFQFDYSSGQGGKLNLMSYAAGTGTTIFQTSRGFALNTIFHIVLRWNRTTGDLSITVDGDYANKETFTSKTTAPNFYSGAYTRTCRNTMSGVYTDTDWLLMRHWAGEIITDAQVQGNYDYEKSRYIANITADAPVTTATADDGGLTEVYRSIIGDAPATTATAADGGIPTTVIAAILEPSTVTATADDGGTVIALFPQTINPSTVTATASNGGLITAVYDVAVNVSTVAATASDGGLIEVQLEEVGIIADAPATEAITDNLNTSIIYNTISDAQVTTATANSEICAPKIMDVDGAIVTNCVVEYLFSAPSSPVQDEMGSNHDCVITNATRTLLPTGAYAYVFDGDGDLGTTTKFDAINNLRTLTVEILYYPETPTLEWPCLIRKGYYAADGWQLTHHNNGSGLYVDISPFDGTNNPYWHTTFSPPKVGEWVYATYTHNKNSPYPAPSLYINGQAVSVTTDYAQYQATGDDSNSDLIIGYLNQEWAGYFKGKIALIRIHNVILTEEEIVTNHNASKWRYQDIIVDAPLATATADDGGLIEADILGGDITADAPEVTATAGVGGLAEVITDIILNVSATESFTSSLNAETIYDVIVNALTVESITDKLDATVPLPEEANASIVTAVANADSATTIISIVSNAPLTDATTSILGASTIYDAIANAQYTESITDYLDADVLYHTIANAPLTEAVSDKLTASVIYETIAGTSFTSATGDHGGQVEVFGALEPDQIGNAPFTTALATSDAAETIYNVTANAPSTGAVTDKFNATILFDLVANAPEIGAITDQLNASIIYSSFLNAPTTEAVTDKLNASTIYDIIVNTQATEAITDKFNAGTIYNISVDAVDASSVAESFSIGGIIDVLANAPETTAISTLPQVSTLIDIISNASCLEAVADKIDAEVLITSVANSPNVEAIAEGQTASILSIFYVDVTTVEAIASGQPAGVEGDVSAGVDLVTATAASDPASTIYNVTASPSTVTASAETQPIDARIAITADSPLTTATADISIADAIYGVIADAPTTTSVATSDSASTITDVITDVTTQTASTFVYTVEVILGEVAAEIANAPTVEAVASSFDASTIYDVLADVLPTNALADKLSAEAWVPVTINVLPVGATATGYLATGVAAGADYTLYNYGATSSENAVGVYSYAFDGISDYMEDGEFQLDTETFSIEWMGVLNATTGADQWIIDRHSGSTGWVLFYDDSAQKFAFRSDKTAWGGEVYVEQIGIADFGQRYHVVVTYDMYGGSDNLKMYIDADLNNSATSTETITNNLSDSLLVSGSNGPANGEYNVVRVFDSELTPSQVQQNFTYESWRISTGDPDTVHVEYGTIGEPTVTEAATSILNASVEYYSIIDVVTAEAVATGYSAEGIPLVGGEVVVNAPFVTAETSTLSASTITDIIVDISTVESIATSYYVDGRPETLVITPPAEAVASNFNAEVLYGLLGDVSTTWATTSSLSADVIYDQLIDVIETSATTSNFNATVDTGEGYPATADAPWTEGIASVLDAEVIYNVTADVLCVEATAQGFNAESRCSIIADSQVTSAIAEVFEADVLFDTIGNVSTVDADAEVLDAGTIYDSILDVETTDATATILQSGVYYGVVAGVFTGEAVATTLNIEVTYDLISYAPYTTAVTSTHNASTIYDVIVNAQTTEAIAENFYVDAEGVANVVANAQVTLAVAEAELHISALIQWLANAPCATAYAYAYSTSAEIALKCKIKLKGSVIDNVQLEGDITEYDHIEGIITDNIGLVGDITETIKIKGEILDRVDLEGDVHT